MIKIHFFRIAYLIAVMNTFPVVSADPLDNIKLTLLTDHFPPLTYQNKEGEFIGSGDLIIKNLFKIANINYKIKSVPWKRAFRELNTNDYFLIYPLSRSKEREKHFVWIAPLFHLKINTYGLRNNYHNIDITQGDYRFACIKTTINCQAVKSLNVPKPSVSEISNVSIKQLIKMVMLRHVDFIMSTEAEFKYTVERLNIDPALFVEVTGYQYIVTDYLAAKTSIDPRIVQRLKSALATDPLSTK